MKFRYKFITHFYENRVKKFARIEDNLPEDVAVSPIITSIF